MLVLDSSATLAWILEEEAGSSDNALELMDRERATVPMHWVLEITNGLRMAVRRRRVSREDVIRFMTELRALPLQVDLQTEVRGWNEIPALAYEHGLTTYDAAYLELALRLDAPLATLDVDLARAARKAGVALFE
jgi:predicted nucleic acid-binding protein